MTKLEAEHRALQLWPGLKGRIQRAGMETFNGHWYVAGTMHGFDQNGHVICDHKACEKAEAKL